MTAPFVLPTVVVGVAFRGLLAPSGPLGSLGLDGTPVAIVAALVFFNLSLVVRVVGPWWSGLDPRREQAAASLGAGPWQVLRTVTLPALVPVVLSVATVVFLFCATAFGIVLTLGGGRWSSVETEIYFLTTRLLDLPAAAALSLVQLLVVAALLALAATAQPRRGDRAGRPGGASGPQPRACATCRSWRWPGCPWRWSSPRWRRCSPRACGWGRSGRPVTTGRSWPRPTTA